MALTDKEIKALKPNPERDYKVADGEGMYLLVSKAGGKSWRFKYRYLGKEKVFVIGKYPYIGLAIARDKRFELKKMLELGIDPNSNKRELRQQAIEAAENTFEKVAREWFEFRKPSWSVSYANDVISRIENNLFPPLGKKPITSITAKDMIAVLQDVQGRGVGELAHRLKQTSGEIFRYANVHGYMTANPAANFHSRDVLKKVEKTHHAAIEAKEIPEFLRKLKHNDACLRPLTRLAIRLLMLTFVRPNEVFNARWDEFDLESRQWVIHEKRMKMRKPHFVPLSDQVIKLLEEVS